MYLLNSKISVLVLVLFSFHVIWWIKLHIYGNLETSSEPYWFNISYGFIALIGGLLGLSLSKKWGGFSSLIGKSIAFLSLGLLSEWVANVIWAYYNIFTEIA